MKTFLTSFFQEMDLGSRKGLRATIILRIRIQTLDVRKPIGSSCQAVLSLLRTRTPLHPHLCCGVNGKDGRPRVLLVRHGHRLAREPGELRGAQLTVRKHTVDARIDRLPLLQHSLNCATLDVFGVIQIDAARKAREEANRCGLPTLRHTVEKRSGSVACISREPGISWASTGEKIPSEHSAQPQAHPPLPKEANSRAIQNNRM